MPSINKGETEQISRKLGGKNQIFLDFKTQETLESHSIASIAATGLPMALVRT